MTYEKPELVLVNAAEAVVLGDQLGTSDNTGAWPIDEFPVGFAAGLDD